MKFCYNTNFALPKQSQRSTELLLGIFKKEPTPPLCSEKGAKVFSIGPFSGSTEIAKYS